MTMTDYHSLTDAILLQAHMVQPRGLEDGNVYCEFFRINDVDDNVSLWKGVLTVDEFLATHVRKCAFVN